MQKFPFREVISQMAIAQGTAVRTVTSSHSRKQNGARLGRAQKSVTSRELLFGGENSITLSRCRIHFGNVSAVRNSISSHEPHRPEPVEKIYRWLIHIRCISAYIVPNLSTMFMYTCICTTPYEYFWSESTTKFFR